MQFPSRCHWVLLTGALWLVLSSTTPRAVDAWDETAWRSEAEMRRSLQSPLGITWSSQPLRRALANLAENQRIAIWLDRRIDPDQQPEWSWESLPLESILRQIAERLQAGVGYVGPVVYIGPRKVAGQLWTQRELHREGLERLPAATRTRWSRAQAAQWPELSTPRGLLQGIAQELGATLEGLELIPHDLWPAISLPPLTAAERLQLILAGFDLTFALADDGRVIRIIAIPDQLALAREYAPRGDPSRAAAELERRFPTASVRRSGTRLAITATAEEHDAIGRLLRGESVRASPAGPAETRYTMEAVNQPIGVVLRTLEVKAQLQIEVDQDAAEALRQLVSFTVKEETLDGLLRAALRDSGLTFQLANRQLRIQRAPP